MIWSLDRRSNDHMSILHVNRSKIKYCVIHNGMMTYEILYLMYLRSLILCDVQEQGTKFWSRRILGNIHAERHYDYFFLTCMHLLLFKCNCFWFWIVTWNFLNCFLCCYNDDCYCSWICSCQWNYFNNNTASM